MLIALFSMICFIFIPFFAQNLQTLLVGEVLQGIPWGVFQTMTTAYASEVAPVALRAYLTTYVNLCWVMGQFIAAGVLRSFLSKGGELYQCVPTVFVKLLILYRRMVLSCPLRDPMDLASSYLHRMPIRSRVAMVVRPQGQDRRSQEVPASSHLCWC